MKFSDLPLAEPVLRAVAAEGYHTATPIQAKAIPLALEGRDLMGCAQTGTGKTAAFALPILHKLASTPRPAGAKPRPRCLILCPTRELATQIGDSFRAYGKNLPIKTALVYGGVGQNPQVDALRRGAEVVIATPGRLQDLMDQRHADLRGIEMLVLDEADRMLDMGFIHAIRRIVEQVPTRRQTMMFSATMPPEIRKLAHSLLSNPASVEVKAESIAADNIEQSVFFVARHNKANLLAHLVNTTPMVRTIVFTRTKIGADRLVRHLHLRGIRSQAIHGNRSQNARQKALKDFQDARVPVLVATDIASRGIDVDGVTHVVNYDLTHEPETYVHRIGRTARAGASGSAVSFCDKDEVTNLRAIERLIRRPIPVREDHPEYPAAPSAAPRQKHHAATHGAQGTQSSHGSQPKRFDASRGGGHGAGNGHGNGHGNSHGGGHGPAKHKPAGGNRGKRRYAR